MYETMTLATRMERAAVRQMRRLDYLVRRLTAFVSFQDMKNAMDGGYVPTIRPCTARHGELARLLRGLGYRVWGNRGRDYK